MSELSPKLPSDESVDEIQDEVKPDVPDKQSFDLCLLKQESGRRVQKPGFVQIFNQIYQGDCLLDPQINKVRLRYDPNNITHILAYTEEKLDAPSRFLGVLKVRDMQEEKLSLTDLKLKQRLIFEGLRQLSLVRSSRSNC
ncbi:Mu transposase C-terminal domain-containing protein [Nodosilinea sp. FACHB-13]|uniref:Mu transposase C-terminal domain-containing protein n=1 Tax=Cyanophyceae TaxID=3028117 RepID=UPI00168215F6|nr:Mu transposase C-terminal domain-containing protein [Nodosilinea sp. FACHB-13]MBD2109988.1 Mu transposase C-terminal domain-containing protein [Nodosilinea sp. FACHB-13]